MGDDPCRQDPNKYRKFKKVDGATYHRVNQFLRKRTYITAREWALARLCTDFRTRSGAEMTYIGAHLPELVPFMQDVYTPQAVNQARNSFKKKVHKAGATFFYGAMCGFFTTDELDDLLFESSEVARFLLEVEGTTLDIDEEIDIEDRITKVMRSVGVAAKSILRERAALELKAEETGERKTGRNRRTSVKVIHIAGSSGSGKTTFIGELLVELGRIGPVATVKHLGHHRYSLEKGKDTTFFYDRGVSLSVGVDDEKAVITRRGGSLHDVLGILSDQGVGFTLIEGFKTLPLPKIVIGTAGNTHIVC